MTDGETRRARSPAAGSLSPVRERAEAIRDRELDRALSRLAATGEVTARERREIERLADRLVDRLVPTAGDAAASEDHRVDAAEEAVLRELFCE